MKEIVFKNLSIEELIRFGNVGEFVKFLRAYAKNVEPVSHRPTDDERTRT